MDWSWQTHHQKLPVFYDHFGLIFKVVLHQEFCCIILPNWWEPSLILHLLTFQHLFPPDNWEYDAFLQQVLSQAPQHLRSSELVGYGEADEWCSTLWQEIAGLHKELTKLESSLVILPELFAYKSGIDFFTDVQMCFLFSASYHLCNQFHSAINQEEQERVRSCKGEGETACAFRWSRFITHSGQFEYKYNCNFSPLQSTWHHHRWAPQ